MPVRLPSTPRLAIDVGTSRLRLLVSGRSDCWDQPTVIALGSGPGGPITLAIGDAALALRDPGSRLVYPLRSGNFENFDALELLLSEALRQQDLSRWRRTAVTVALPGDLSPLERQALKGSLAASGFGAVTWVPAVLAAALGAQLPVMQPTAHLVVLMGAARTDIALLSFGGFLGRRSLRSGGQDVDQRILAWMRRQHDVLITPEQASQIRHLHGSGPVVVVARQLVSGLAVEVPLDLPALRSACADIVARVRDAVLDVLREAPPDACADLLDGGIMLTGGGAQIPGLDQALRDATGLPVLLASEPDRCVINGLAATWDDPDLEAALRGLP